MRCHAHRRDGEQCGSDAVKGATVCRMHGGSAPQVKAAARRRLLEAVDPVVAKLIDLALRDPDPRIALAACRDILDRVGLAEPKQVEVITIDLVEREIARLEAELAEAELVGDG
jgi:hypothetical protein